MFGPNYHAVTASARYTRTVYGERDPTTGTFPVVGQVEDSDPFELRRLALTENLLGRYGRYAGVTLVMLWNQPPGWEERLRAVIETLGVPDHGVVTVGCGAIGLVADLCSSRVAGAEPGGEAG
jgi:hypothetical protein